MTERLLIAYQKQFHTELRKSHALNSPLTDKKYTFKMRKSNVNRTDNTITERNVGSCQNLYV